MKAYTSRERFDERRRFTGTRERMGQMRLDSDANEQVVLARTDARRRSGDLAEGSPDDGFLVSELHLLDPIASPTGWDVTGLAPGDERVITPELGLARRDPESLPHVLRSRGHTRVVRVLPEPVDLLRLPAPAPPSGSTYPAAAIVLQVRFEQDLTDDEITDVRAVARDANGTEHDVGLIVERSRDWSRVRIPVAALAPLRGGPPQAPTLRLGGWGLRGLPPRAEVMIDALLAEDGALGDDLVIRGGDGTLAGAGRIYRSGYRAFIESDWRYSRQPDLPNPAPIVRPPTPADAGDGDGAPVLPHYALHLDIWERPIHAFQDRFLAEPALGGVDTGFRTRKVVQVRAAEVAEGGSESLLSPIGNGLLSTNIPEGERPDRYPAEEPDPCRDRCLFTENLSTGEGYLGQHNINVRVEALSTHLARPVIGWSRENAAVVAPLVAPAVAGANVVHVDPSAAEQFAAGDTVVIEDERSRLDGGRDIHRADLRRLRAVNTGTGELELEPAGTLAATTPDPLDVGGPLSRGFAVQDAAAVRRWDGVDWLLTNVRYNLVDGITWAFDGDDFRVEEYWTFTARVFDPDGSARGVVETLEREPVRGPWHERVALARVLWTATGREIVDLREKFLPLHEVRGRLIELGRRKLAPGAFTVVVGDGVDTFGDIDQNIAEGVHGDEAIQAAVNRLADLQIEGGTVYVRAGRYSLEHPVLVRNRSTVRILGDGDATELTVTGAGGAFYLDWCGHGGEVTIEKLRLVESPGEETPFGAGTLVGDLPVTPIAPGLVIRRFVPDDLLSTAPLVPDLIVDFARSLRDLRPFEGRAAESVVATIVELRRRQRVSPGRPLEEVAPEELDVLRRLPHGVVTVADSSRVRLRDLVITSREQGQDGGVVAAGVLVTGSCADVVVSGCRIEAPSGVVAGAYGRALAPHALVARPRSGLFLRVLTVSDNQIVARGDGSFGVRIADGIVDGLSVSDNRVEGFRFGISLEDQAETRAGEPVDRSSVHGNLVTGSRAVGVLVSGDGVDVAANEVRVGGEREELCAAIQLTGTANRVRDCWISFPDGDRPPLGLHAGIVVGSGVVGAARVTRPVTDIEITGNRIEGGGAMVTGVLIGGSQPIFDVRVVGNTIRNLGDAGVRAWANAGSVGGLRIEENSIEGVARAYVVWSEAAVAALRDLAGDIAIAAQATPRDALDTVLGVTTDISAALDAALRFLEHATLRGGIALSLVEESEVRRNRIVDVGTRTLPPGFANPGAPIRTAGVAVAGGRDLAIEGNVVRRVQAPVQVVAPVIEPIPPVRPDIFDKLHDIRVLPTPGLGIGIDLHGAVVALRRDLLEYATGNARVRQRLGGSVYAAMESIGGALESGSPERRRLAAELTGGLTRMQEAQGFADHTASSNHVRATLSRVASLTAPDEKVAEAWAVAARVDDALLAGDDAVVEVATEVLTTADDLEQDLGALGLGLAGKAEAVIGGSGSVSTRTKARLDLARALGTVAEGRAGVAASEQARGGAAMPATDRAVAEGIVTLSLDSLATPDAAELNDEAVVGIERGADALAEVLRGAHPALADRVRRDVNLLRDQKGAVLPEQIGRLRETLGVVRGFAAGEPVPEIRADDIDAQHDRFHAELVTLTADQVERRVAGLAADPESVAQRNLRLLDQSVGQLVNLVGNERELRVFASGAQRAIRDAIAEPERRGEHEAEARRLLHEIQERQAGRIGTGAPPAAVTSAAPTTETTTPVDLDVRLAGMGELLLAVRELDDPALRSEGVGIADVQLRQVVDAAAISGAEREQLLATIAEATGVLGSNAGAAAKDGAVHRLAGVVETVSYRAAQRADATPELRAVHVVNGALARALDVTRSEAERVSTVGQFVAGHGDLLSTSLAATLSAAVTPADVLAGARGALTGLAGIRPLPRPIPPIARVEAHPADGVYVAGAQRRLDLRANELEDARTGGTVAGQADHVLAPAADAPALSLVVEANQVAGGAICGLDLRPDGSASLAVVDNEITASAGAGPNPEPEPGQSVVHIAGSGDLLIATNRVRDNGNRRAGGIVHEFLVDWRGDIVVRDNLVRHSGGADGGAAVALLIGPVPAPLVRSVSSQPALVAEPPPAPPPPVVGPSITPGLLDLPDFVAAGLGPSAGVLTGASSFGVGGFQLATRLARPSFSLLEAAVEPAPTVDLAELRADQWLDLVRPERFHPLLDFLDRRPPPVVIIQPRARRSVHVVGNDVVADGPALLLLVEGGDLVSATVVGNELQSSRPTGAVYLRNVDTTVFGSNRCECLGDVNVVVVRARRSLVSVMGNVAVGKEPVAPPLPPFVPVRPDRFDLGEIHLAVKVGEAAALNLRLDETAMLDAIAQRKASSFSSVAADAEASYTLFATRQKILTLPAGGLSFASLASRAKLVVGGQPGTPTIEVPVDLGVVDGGEADGGGDAGVGDLGVLTTVVANSNQILADTSLSAPAKLFGVAVASGMAAHQARALVQTQLVQAGGDEQGALSAGLGIITGLDEVGPTVTERVRAANPVEDILSLLLRNRHFEPVRPLEPLRPPIITLPPRQQTHRMKSIVLLGGSRVGAVNNVTTAGVLVVDAAHSIENNL